ncbi:MAG TPA: EVE domain-containing protein [Turneriella sp.]|nr:EVE domain-containing protein [Turneriella sp.]
MKSWILKSEPDAFSIDMLAELPDQTTLWDGVRNYMARNHLMAMKVGDRGYFYHSSCKVPAIVGEVRIVSEAEVDETQFNLASKYYDAKSTHAAPRWFCPRVKFLKKYEHPLSREVLKEAGLENSQLFTSFRLSVIALTSTEAKIIEKLLKVKS